MTLRGVPPNTIYFGSGVMPAARRDAMPPRFGQDDPQETSQGQPATENPAPEPGLMRMILLYGQGRLAQAREQRRLQREWDRERHQREVRAISLAFDAFPPPTFVDRVKPVPFQRKREIIHELLPLIDAGIAPETINDILRPIAEHDHPLIRHDLVFNLLGKLKNDQAKACVLSRTLRFLRKESCLEVRQKLMEVIESLPPEPIPKELHPLLYSPLLQDHIRYWAAKQFLRDADPDIRSRAEAVMATSAVPSKRYR